MDFSSPRPPAPLSWLPLNEVRPRPGLHTQAAGGNAYPATAPPQAALPLHVGQECHTQTHQSPWSRGPWGQRETQNNSLLSGNFAFVPCEETYKLFGKQY